MSSQQNSRFNADQYATILNFLEDPQNYAQIFGVRGKTEVGVAPPRKIQAWKELAALINNKFKGKYKVDHKSIADRWRTYFNKYKVAREKSSATGFGVTDEDKQRGIHTVQAKLDMMCPHYERMHALVGERPNVQPAACFESGSITPGTDLNELLRFTSADDVHDLNDVEAPMAQVDSSTLHEVTGYANEDGVDVQTLMDSNEVVLLKPPADQLQVSPVHEGLLDEHCRSEFDASPSVPADTKRRATLLDNSDGKKAKKDHRKVMPSLADTKNPSLARNHIAQTIQDCASAKSAALFTIEKKKLKFEQMKWETTREEREISRQEDKEDRLRIDELERVRRAEDKAEKCRERRFALLQTLIKDGKSAEEINLLLSMLL